MAPCRGGRAHGRAGDAHLLHALDALSSTCSTPHGPCHRGAVVPELPVPRSDSLNDLRLHIAESSPWLVLLLVSSVLIALGIWAYRFKRPPLPAAPKLLLPALRVLALTGLLWLLAQPVLERALPGRGARVAILLDRSRSMELPAAAGGEARAAIAERASRALAADLRSRARIEVVPFAADLDSAGSRDVTALGDALAALAARPAGERPDGVVVVSDGAVNAGVDPLQAARALAAPVHVLPVGSALSPDRAVTEVESSPTARVGEPTLVRVRVRSTEEQGTPLEVRVLEDGRERARGRAIAAGAGAEATLEVRVTPSRPGLAVWTAQLTPIEGDVAPLNDARGVAVQVQPGRLGVLVVSNALQWDLTFLRRALLADSGLALSVRVRAGEGGAWRASGGARAAAPTPQDLAGRAVVVLDGIAAAEVSAAFDQALARFVREGGGLLLLGGEAPGVMRFGSGALAAELRVQSASTMGRTAGARLEAGGVEVAAWDDDPARGTEAWSRVAPLSEVMPLTALAGDRVLASAVGGGEPLLFSRRAGRGPVMFVNGSGTWRWSLSGTDPLQSQRGPRLWQRIVRWLSEPVQAEPLRVTPERWLTPAGESVRLLASLQDAAFQPVAGATLEGEAVDGAGHRMPLRFVSRAAGSYEAVLPAPAAGRWNVNARALREGRELARARSEFAVDRWSLELASAQPDRAGLEALAASSGGRVLEPDASQPSGRLQMNELARPRTSSTRLWESPWVFALLIGMLSVEWAWRRLRGLP